MITLHCRPAGAVASEIRIGCGLRHGLAAAAGDRPGFGLIDARIAAAEPQLWPPPLPRLCVEAGEALKTFAGLERVLRALAQAGLDRSGRLLAIGGGSVGDTGGLAASLYLRGIELWQLPTTLLAMVDSAVGGKTAINLPEGKNLVGSVHPAAQVWIDLELTRTESEPQFRSGLAETVKMAIGCDAGLFALLHERHERVRARDLEVLADVVGAALAAKIAIVEQDLRETGGRRRLNLGHSLAHALEAHSGWTLPHGLAVARGLHFAIAVARRLDAIAAADADACLELLRLHGYEPTTLPPAAALLPFLQRDKKADGAVLHFVVPTGIGSSAVVPLPMAQLRTLLEA